MKSLLLLCLLLTGCSSVPNHLKNAIPDGNWKSISATVTGKFSGTKIEGKNVVKIGDTITAEELHITHSNSWIPLIQIDATGYKPPLQ